MGTLDPWPRAWLFAPADDRGKLNRALSSRAEAVIADLEDSVAPGRKEDARENALEFLRSPAGAPPAPRIVRINDPRGEHGRLDLERLRAMSPTVMVPKACLATLDEVHALGMPTVALVETAHGLAEVEQIAARGLTIAVAIGTVDLAAELELGELPDGAELHYARSRVVLACALGAIPAIDGPQLGVSDFERLRAEALRARALGFAGKLCIHPAQLEIVIDAFTPTDAEVAQARRTIDSYERSLSEGRGVTLAGEQMVDAASVRRARRTLARLDTHLYEMPQ
jgi:citrate lyase subunit beta/citryl-CoA lyase